MFCDNCGKNLKGVSGSFCDNCGEKINHANKPAPSEISNSGVSNSPVVKKRGSKIIPITLIIVALAGTAAAVYFFFGNGGRQHANNDYNYDRPSSYVDGDYSADVPPDYPSQGERPFIAATNQYEVIPPIYDSAQSFSEGLAVVSFIDYDENRYEYGFVDTAGNIVIPMIYGRAFSFSEGLAAVLNGKWGYIDHTGDTVIPFQFDFANRFSEGFAAVQRGFDSNRADGFIDRNGHLAIPYQFDFAGNFSEGLAAVRRDTERTLRIETGFIDSTVRLTIPFSSPAFGDFKDGCAWFSDIENNRAGYIGRNGNIILQINGRETEHIFAFDFSEGLGLVESRFVILEPNYEEITTYSFYDPSGNAVMSLDMYGIVLSFSEGLAAVMRNGLWGFIDINANEVIPPRYDRVQSFSEGLAAVRRNGLWGFIDRAGNEVIPATLDYSEVWGVSEGMAMVQSHDGKYGFIAVPAARN